MKEGAPNFTNWRVGSVVILLVGALSSFLLLAYAGGGVDLSISGTGFWVVAPYLLSCVLLVIARSILAQKWALIGVSLIVGVGMIGYVDALFWNPDAQSALVFTVLPLAQMGLSLAFTVVAGVGRFLSARRSSD